MSESIAITYSDEQTASTPTATVPPTDELVQYLQARGRLDAKVSPDAAAKVKSLSKSTGVSEPVAQRNEGLLQELEQAKQVQQLVETSPKVAKWLAKDGNFALAKDDLEALARIEQRSRERGRTAGDMITGAGASLLRMAPRAASTLSRSAWQRFSMAAASVESAAKGANDALVVSPDIRAMGLGLGASRPMESVARGLKNFGLAQSEYLRKEILDTGKVDPEQADAWLSTQDGFASRWAGTGQDRADMLKMIRATSSGVQAERSFHQPLDPSVDQDNN
jgi:hypothetical protein